MVRNKESSLARLCQGYL